MDGSTIGAWANTCCCCSIPPARTDTVSPDLVAGSYLLDAPDYETAVELANGCPVLEHGLKLLASTGTVANLTDGIIVD
jgi:hypothetical protein